MLSYFGWLVSMTLFSRALLFGVLFVGLIPICYASNSIDEFFWEKGSVWQIKQLESFEFNFENSQQTGVDLQRDGFNIYGFLKGSSNTGIVVSSNIRIENQNNRHLLISIKIQNKETNHFEQVAARCRITNKKSRFEIYLASIDKDRLKSTSCFLANLANPSFDYIMTVTKVALDSLLQDKPCFFSPLSKTVCDPICGQKSKNPNLTYIPNLERITASDLSEFKWLNRAPDEEHSMELDVYNRGSSYLEGIADLQTAYFGWPSEQNRDALLEGLHHTIESGYISEIKKDSDGTRGQMARFLKLVMWSYFHLKKNGDLTPSEDTFLSTAIRSRFNYLKDREHPWFTQERCVLHEDLFGCQNHIYDEAHLRTLYGFIFNDEEEFRAGERVYRFALDDLKEDGALWREASRGWWSWTYYGLGLNFLTGIGEIYQLKGEDLFSIKSDVSGHKLDGAIQFLAEAIEDPTLMWNYSSASLGLVGRDGEHTNDYWLKRTLNDFSNYHFWYFVLSKRSPKSDALKNFEKHFNASKKAAIGDWAYGYNPQCPVISKSSFLERQKALFKNSIFVPLGKPNSNAEQSNVNEYRIQFDRMKSKDNFVAFNGKVSDQGEGILGPKAIKFGLMFDLENTSTSNQPIISNFKIGIESEYILSKETLAKIEHCPSPTYWKEDGVIEQVNIYMFFPDDNICLMEALTTAETRKLSLFKDHVESFIEAAEFPDEEMKTSLGKLISIRQ